MKQLETCWCARRLFEKILLTTQHFINTKIPLCNCVRLAWHPVRPFLFRPHIKSLRKLYRFKNNYRNSASKSIGQFFKRWKLCIVLFVFLIFLKTWQHRFPSIYSDQKKTLLWLCVLFYKFCNLHVLMRLSFENHWSIFKQLWFVFACLRPVKKPYSNCFRDFTRIYFQGSIGTGPVGPEIPYTHVIDVTPRRYTCCCDPFLVISYTVLRERGF